MMTTLERKKYLKNKIDTTDDFEILDKIEKIFEENDEIYVFSDDQKKRISEAITEYLKGNFLTEDEANDDIEKWLEEEN